MTKKELFEILENCPDDAEIYIETDGAIDGNMWGSIVRDPIPRIKMVKDYLIAERPCEETSEAKKSIVL